MRKKSDITISSVSLESFSHGNNDADDDDDDDIGMEESDDRASSNTSLPSLAVSANLTANTTSFIVEAREKLQAHTQHMSQLLPGKAQSETELTATVSTPKLLTTRQGHNSMVGKKESYQYGALVSPLVRKRATKAAWRSAKADANKSSLFASPPKNNASHSISLRNQVDVPTFGKASPEIKRQSNKTTTSRVSQISLNYQEATKEKAATQQQLQRKLKAEGFSSLPLPRKAKSKSPLPTMKHFSTKGISLSVCAMYA